MHASSVDLSETLFALGKTGPPTAPVFVPTPNHSHVVDNSRVNSGPIWWEVRPVLILFESDWPTADGSRGITSSRAMDEAEAAGRAIEVGSNFFLFFSSGLSSRVAASRAKLGPNVGDPGVRTRLGVGVRVPFARAPTLAQSSVSNF